MNRIVGLRGVFEASIPATNGVGVVRHLDPTFLRRLTRCVWPGNQRTQVDTTAAGRHSSAPALFLEEGMKTASFAFAIALGLSTATLAGVKTETIKVNGWKCEKCPAKTEAKLKTVQGVESASADREKNQVVVKYDDSKTKLADLDKAIADSGFTASK